MIDAHRGAFEYDWRTRFHVALKVVGKSMTWGEAWRLTQVLLSDSGSQVAAALAGWDYPVDRTASVLMDLYDLEHFIAWRQGGGKGSKPPRYPRPATAKRKAKPDPSLTQEQILNALRAAGHDIPLPHDLEVISDG